MANNSVGKTPRSGNKLIDSLVYGYRHYTKETDGIYELTYYFHGEDSFDYDDGKRAHFNSSSEWTEIQKARLQKSLLEYLRVSNLTFKEVDNGDTAIADIDIRKANIDEDTTRDWLGGSTGVYAYKPSESTGQIYNDVVLRSDYYEKPYVLEEGRYYVGSQIHEFGHAIGLAHPHKYDIMPKMFDDDRYTVMSYNNESKYHASSIMALDIAAVQYLYGEAAAETGDNTYKLEELLDKTYKTIWDTDGYDTISYSGDKDVIIDLRGATLNYDDGIVAGGYFSGYYDGNAYNNKGGELKGGYYIAGDAVEGGLKTVIEQGGHRW